MTLYLIRHAHAGNKHQWSGPDGERPLSAKGRGQSEHIADDLGDGGVQRIISSRAVRCCQTLAPLAQRLRLSIEPSDSLAEGTPPGVALDLLRDLAVEGVDAALCSHGDVIPAVVQALAAEGLKGDGHLASAKAGVFILDTSDGRITHSRYVPPPDVSDRRR